MLVFALYALLASTFSLSKAALDYIGPNLLVAIRMIVAGLLLLGYWRLFGRGKKAVLWQHAPIFLSVSFFHIFLSYVPEHWALKYMISAKACLAFNLSPFITAVFERYIFGRIITTRQLGTLALGFASFLPLLLGHAPTEQVGGALWRFSLPELAILVAVVSASYGWILVKQLVVRHGYSPLCVNGVSMLCGGMMALGVALAFSETPSMTGCLTQTGCWPDRLIVGYLGAQWGQVASLTLYIALLILITNILFYNLYAYLMRCYSATFLSLCGLMTPLFAALFGFLMRGEQVALPFFMALAGVSLALFVFYQDEVC